MRNLNSPLSPEMWLRDMFASKAVQEGAVNRRKAREIERFAGLDRFMAAVRPRGQQVAGNGGQMLIVCNGTPVRWLTGPAARSRMEKAHESLSGFRMRPLR
jgi:hypothetical protein